MSVYSLDGTHEGEDARLTYDEDTTKVTGWPTGAVNDGVIALMGLADGKQSVAATPTGPFFEADSPEARYLTLIGCLDLFPTVSGDPPVFGDYGYELPEVEQALEGDAAAKAVAWYPRLHPRGPHGEFSHTEDDSGDGFVFGADGQRYWGKYGAAGVLLRHTDPEGVRRYFLTHRSPEVEKGDTWGVPGGALNRGESPVDGGLRELHEETGIDARDSVLVKTHVVRPIPEWEYTTAVRDVTHMPTQSVTNWETADSRWLTEPEMRALNLHPALSASLDDLLDTPPVGKDLSDFVELFDSKSRRVWVKPHERNGREVAGFWRVVPGVEVSAGMTPFRPEDDPHRFLDSDKAARFIADMETVAKKHGVKIDGHEPVAGLWKGSSEPAYSVAAHDGEDGVRKWAEEIRGLYRQDGVYMFDPNGKGQVEYALRGVNERRALQAMQEVGIDGGRIRGNRLEIWGDHELAHKVASLAHTLGVGDVDVREGSLITIEGG